MAKTPNKQEILRKATELWHMDRARSGDPSFDRTPEENELKEDGFLNVAVSELMRNTETKWQCFDREESDKDTMNHENLVKEGVFFDPVLAMDSGFYVSGTSQSGKTNLAKWLVQMLMQNGITVYVLDTSKAWLRNTPIKNVITVNASNERYDWQDNVVFDISALNTRQKVLFVNELCKNIYTNHVDGYLAKEFIVFEEAQTYIPQGSMRLAVRRKSPCESVLDVVTVGANYGVRFGLVTQFPALVDKPPVKITQQRYFGWTWEKNDIAYIKGFISKDWIEKLLALKKGDFIYQNKEKTSLIHCPLFENQKENEIARNTTLPLLPQGTAFSAYQCNYSCPMC